MVAYNEEPYEGNDEGSNYSTNGEDTGSDTEEDDHLDTTAEFSSIQPDALKQLQKIYKQHNHIRNLGASEKLGSKRFAGFAGFAGYSLTSRYLIKIKLANSWHIA